ncbi:basic leucine zipper transcriptional factor ATF-like 3 isoform X2 [Cavia porcellus]|uniref:basic leucine zipper transcriptional factor ATF-like 3 isoform X2 n=1 Tax=Cavia porcellus TaxID=10141 RepID=UPI002FDFEE16
MPNGAPNWGCSTRAPRARPRAPRRLRGWASRSRRVSEPPRDFHEAQGSSGKATGAEPACRARAAAAAPREAARGRPGRSRAAPGMSQGLPAAGGVSVLQSGVAAPGNAPPPQAGSQCVAQTGRKLGVILSPQPPECWGIRALKMMTGRSEGGKRIELLLRGVGRSRPRRLTSSTRSTSAWSRRMPYCAGRSPS